MMTTDHDAEIHRNDLEIPTPPSAYAAPTPPANPTSPVSPAPASPSTMDPELERQLVAAAHWSPLASVLLGGLTFFGPLIVLLVNNGRSARVREHAVDALNFQLSVWAIAVAVFLVSLPLVFVLVGFLGLFLAPMIPLAALVVHLIASMQVAAGHEYRYPLTYRFIK